jgi:hypothetical protein
MRNVSRVLVAVLVVSLGGCSGDLATRPMPSKSPSSSPSPSEHATPAGPSAADRRYLRQSVRNLLVGESVEFEFAHRYGDEAFLQGSGTP